jgi:nucleoside-diphosphate-sugar epimerase
MPESLFVTGGTGFLGSGLLSNLANGRYRRIVCLTRRPPAVRPPNVEFVAADLLETGAYASALTGCDTVLHMAAATGKSRRAEYFRVNLEGTKALIGESRRAGVRRMIYISTIAAKFQDQSRYYYGQSKRQAEELLAGSGLEYAIVRPTIIFGEGAPVLAGLARLAAAPILPVFGNGRALVQPVSVSDLAVCLAEIVNENVPGSRAIEIGGPQVLSMEELLVKIRRHCGRAEGPVLHLPAKAIAVGLGLIENLVFPLLPFTAGQIASFMNDGVAASDPCLTKWQARMQNVDQMLSAAKFA